MKSFKKMAFLVSGLLALIILTTAASCDAATDEKQQTYNNRQQINSSQPVPNITYSQRRSVLIDYYGQVLNKPRLRTCTMITSRGSGGNAGNDIIGIAETLGMPVNLSNQVTDPNGSEPDSIYPGTNEQTVLTLRNGQAIVTEADTTAITGDCPTNVHPSTEMQAVIDFESALPPAKKDDPNRVNFCPNAQCENR